MKKKLIGMSMSALAALALVACASTPPPTDQLARAESAIKRAEEARVADYASPDLKAAREKLASARAAVTRDEMALAARLAEQARVDAEVATAKAEAAKAQSNIEELQKANAAIQQESLRNSTPAAPALPPPPPPKPIR